MLPSEQRDRDDRRRRRVYRPAALPRPARGGQGLPSDALYPKRERAEPIGPDDEVSLPIRFNPAGRGTEARAWSIAVRKRDGACRRCGTTKGLVAHHIKPWAKHPELRYDVANGETLCRSCHRKEHPELPAHLFEPKSRNV